MQRKWEVLSDTLLGTGAYYAPRLTPRKLSSRFYAGRAVIRETNEREGDRTIRAYAALWPTPRSEWYELGTIYVGEQLRGNGLRDELMAEAIALVPRSARLFLLTPVEAIMRSAVRLGFEPVTMKARPDLLGWASEVGIVARLPSSVHPQLVRAGESFWGRPERGERWLFVRR